MLRARALEGDFRVSIVFWALGRLKGVLPPFSVATNRQGYGYG